MKYGIGIDTGGTYTDAVIYDFETSLILDSAKSRTTHEDLSIGILGALDALNPELVHQVSLLSLSTTLATNACVENRGGRSKLLFIGVEAQIVNELGAASGLDAPDKICYLDAKTTINGEILTTPDWDDFLADSTDWFADANALAIVELHAMNNGAILEKEARRRILENYDLPVICGYELFSDLSTIKRGAGTLLNGQLIPVLAEFLTAIKKALAERHLNLPVTIVRSGLTPTDIMHLKGDFDCFPTEASKLGAQFVANCIGINPDTLCDLVYETIKKKLYMSIATMLLKENMPSLAKDDLHPQLISLLERTYEMARKDSDAQLQIRLQTPSSLIGVGAPIHIFLPDVAAALRTRCQIPDLAGVVNAVGAIAGNITASCTVAVKPFGNNYQVQGKLFNETITELEDARALAHKEAKKEAREEAILRGASGDIVINILENPQLITTNYGSELFMGSSITATAIGKIALGE